jgi:hypothetical protein
VYGEAPISAFVNSFLSQKRRLNWTEISSLELTTYLQVFPILSLLLNLRELFICSDRHLQFSRPEENQFYMPEDLIISVLRYFSFFLLASRKTLRVLDLKHNLETLTDSFLENIKHAPNLKTLRLPSHSLFTNIGLSALQSSPCVSKLTVFSLESSVIWNNARQRIRPSPAFTQVGLMYLLKSTKNLEELCLDIVISTSGFLIDDVIFDIVKRLSILKLSGPGLVDMRFISRLALESPRLKTLDLEGSLIDISGQGIPNLVKAIGSTLIELRICVEDRKTQSNLLAIDCDFLHPVVRYSECSRYPTI